MAIEKELLDQLLAGREPNEVFAKDGLLDDLKKALSERILNAELDEIAKLEPEQFIVPLGVLMRAIVHQPIGACLRRRQPFGHMDRHSREAEDLGGLEPCVADDDDHFLVDDDRLAKAKLGDRGFDRVDRGGVVARVCGLPC